MKPFTRAAVALVSGLIMFCDSQAVAVDDCKGKITPSDGTVTVQGSNVTGTLRWCTSTQPDCSSPQNCQPVPEPRCIRGGRANSCKLSLDSLGRITPPDTCTVCLRDDGTNSCGAYVKGCVPANRGLPGAALPAMWVGTNSEWITGVNELVVTTSPTKVIEIAIDKKEDSSVLRISCSGGEYLFGQTSLTSLPKPCLS